MRLQVASRPALEQAKKRINLKAAALPAWSRAWYDASVTASFEVSGARPETR